METIRIVGPRPRPDVAFAAERERARAEERARRQLEIDARAKANPRACPQCGFTSFGDYRPGTRCMACHYRDYLA
jgi:hypothetical protein